MLAFLKPYWLEIVKWSGIILAGIAVFFSIKQSGRNAERVDQLKKDNKNAKEIIRQDSVVSTGDADIMRTRLSTALRRKRNP